MNGKKLSFTMRYVLAFGVLLFVANVALGILIVSQSRYAMKQLINKDMLDVVKSAAGSLDSDALGSLTQKDVDGPAFNEIKRRLLVFKNSVDIEYIYAVRKDAEGQFVFTVDPDPEEPAEFGEEVLVTPALISAGNGEAAVDDSPAEDEWGNFYSAYCPVLDSNGRIVGIVGVDFDAKWYDDQVAHYTVSIAAVTTASILVGVIVVTLVSRSVRRRFLELERGLSELSGDVDQLVGDMASHAGYAAPQVSQKVESSANDVDELEMISDRINVMREELGTYLDYLQAQAYTDALTNTDNFSAYDELVRAVEQRIATGTADFWVAVFDINSLKELNDNYGHECGNVYIKAAAQIVGDAFAGARTFRIGGDEFTVIAEGFGQEKMDECLGKVDESVAAFNASQRPCPAMLALSKGAAQFEADGDATYKDVFDRADTAMYHDKREYYRTVGDRRGRRRD